MKIAVVTIGKPKGVGRDLADMYIKRSRKYFKLYTSICRDEKEILRKFTRNSYLVALDERGEQKKSPVFAEFIKTKQFEAVNTLVFALGPAEGWSNKMREQANMLLSLSRMSLQHDLALGLLWEQIYRAGTIINGEPYHK